LPGTLSEEELTPIIIIRNVTQFVDSVQDSDEKPKYTAAAVVWSIFFVILLLAIPTAFYLNYNARKTFAIENSDMKRQQERVKEKRGKLEENQLLIEKQSTVRGT
jgi:uncharacterized membrane protein (DUF106 family)